ncbi:MAG: hypothetical protein K2M73_09960 [Lachnospiraceae bacterium]|nr:hypothetical protein [Lachnospiraceae bacterium]
MSIHYNDDFKKEVVRAYMAGNKSTVQIVAAYDIAKSSISQWAKEYSEEYPYTTSSASENNEAKEIRRLNQLLNEKDKEIAFLKKSSSILREGNRLVVYRFIDNYKNLFGLRWLCRQFGISPNCYYNYKKEAKYRYHKRLTHIFEHIKYVYYNNNRVIGYRSMRIFIKCYGFEISKTTMHKYMNKELNLCAIIMYSKPGYKAGKKHKIFDNLLNHNFIVNCINKVLCTDFTYMSQPNCKFRYNCSIIDLYDRAVIA